MAGKNGRSKMGKKHKHLYNQITPFENLWKASKNARRGKRNKYSTTAWAYLLEKERILDSNGLLISSGTWGEI